MIILGECQGATCNVYSRVREWSKLPDIHWPAHSQPDSYKQNVNGAWQEEIKERDMRKRIHSFTSSLIPNAFPECYSVGLGKVLGI